MPRRYAEHAWARWDAEHPILPAHPRPTAPPAGTQGGAGPTPTRTSAAGGAPRPGQDTPRPAPPVRVSHLADPQRVGPHPRPARLRETSRSMLACAIVPPVPVPYREPLFQRLARRPELAIRVIYQAASQPSWDQAAGWFPA